MRFLRNNQLLAVVIPFYNEGPRIIEFAARLRDTFRGAHVCLYFIDDCSTDGFSPSLVPSVDTDGPDLVVFRNDQNLGHGPSVLRGLAFALNNGAHYLLTLDGDGNVDETEFMDGLNGLPSEGWDVVVFNRINRSQEWFRVVTTYGARMLVFLKAGRLVPDANTPFRLYRRSSLLEILDGVGDRSKVPNLLSSIVMVQRGMAVINREISENLHGQNTSGVTWGTQSRWRPSTRFLRFVMSAVSEIFRFRDNVRR